LDSIESSVVLRTSALLHIYTAYLLFLLPDVDTGSHRKKAVPGVFSLQSDQTAHGQISVFICVLFWFANLTEEGLGMMMKV